VAARRLLRRQRPGLRPLVALAQLQQRLALQQVRLPVAGALRLLRVRRPEDLLDHWSRGP
jgi:hypothetical protein